jgi:hypothetical protein
LQQLSPTGTGGLWQQITPTQWCVNCNNTEFNWTNINYNCSFYGSVQYKLDITDLDGNVTENTTTITIDYDNVNVTSITPPNGETINRTDTTYFVIGLYDTDNSSYPNNASGKIWISPTSGLTWDNPDYTYSNSSGHLIRQMGPSDWGCSAYALGSHYWKGGTQGSNCFPGLKDNVTGSDHSITFTLMGNLTSAITQPLGTQNYTIGQYITFGGSVAQDSSCPAVTDATVYFNITNGTTSYTCSASSNGDGTYTCSNWDTVGKSTGWYNVTMNSSKTDYYNGIANQVNAFYLRSPILLNDVIMQPNGGGSYGNSPFNFTVNVTSTDGENVTVYLWLHNTSGWFLENQSSCYPCDKYLFNFSKNYDCNNIDSWQYMLNASSSSGAVNNSLSANSFSVSADTISINYVSGNESYINRSDSNPGYDTAFVVQMMDTVKNQYITDVPLTNVHAYVTKSDSDWMELTGGIGSVTNNSTHYNVTFNPNCSFSAGKRQWKFNVSGYSCYANVQSNSYNVSIVGNLNPYYTSPVGGRVYDLGDNVPLLGNLTDDCSNNIINSNVQFQLNSSPTTSYYCSSPGNTTGNYYSCNWYSDSHEVGFYNVTMTSWNNSYNNGTAFQINATQIRSIPRLNAADVNPRSAGWIKTFSFTVNVTDNTGDIDTTYLWSSPDGNEPWTQIGSSQNCTSCSNTTLMEALVYYRDSRCCWRFSWSC